MTPDLARRIVLATLDPVMFGIVHDTALAVAAGRPVQVDYGFTVAEVEAAVADRAEMSRAYHDLSGRDDFVTATLKARLGWLAGLEADRDRDADRRRLDWLEAWGEIQVECWPLAYEGDRPTRYTVTVWDDETDDDARVGQGLTLRAAIDAAMAGWAAKAETKKGGEGK